MAVAAPLMMIAGTGMSALSTYRQGQYASNQAKAQAKISDYNAQVADADATAIKQKSIFDQVRAVKSGARKVGSLRAGMSTSGAVLSEGAPATAVAQQAYENALDVAMIGYEGMVGARKQRSAAAMYRASAANQRSQAKYAKRAGTFGAVTKLLTGFGSMAMMGAFGGGGAATGTSPQLGQSGVSGFHVP